MQEKIFKTYRSGGEFRQKFKEYKREMVESYIVHKRMYPSRYAEESEMVNNDLELAVFDMIVTMEKNAQITSNYIVVVANMIHSEELMFLRLFGIPDRIEALNEWYHQAPENKRCVENTLMGGALTMLYIYNKCEREEQDAQESYKVDKAMRLLMSAIKEKEWNENNERAGDDLDLKIPLALRIKQHLDAGMYAQETAKKNVAVSVSNFIESRGAERMPILLEGSTGSGKTLIYELLKNYEPLNRQAAFISCTATDLTANGFDGKNVTHLMKEIKTGLRKKEKELAIVFLDEIDKLTLPNTDAAGEDVNATVLSQLLTALAGTQEYEGVDTRKVLWILAGAFEELENQRAEEHRNIGFGQIDAEENECYDLRSDLIKIGVSRQFIGRIGSISHMDKLSASVLKKIVRDTLDRKEKLFERKGSHLIYDEEMVDALVEKLEDYNTGARSALSMVETIIGTAEYDILEKMPYYDTVHLHKGIILNGEKPIFENSRAHSCS